LDNQALLELSDLPELTHIESEDEIDENNKPLSPKRSIIDLVELESDEDKLSFKHAKVHKDSDTGLDIYPAPIFSFQEPKDIPIGSQTIQGIIHNYGLFWYFHFSDCCLYLYKKKEEFEMGDLLGKFKVSLNQVNKKFLGVFTSNQILSIEKDSIYFPIINKKPDILNIELIPRPAEFPLMREFVCGWSPKQVTTKKNFFYIHVIM
jgi:hypothetical protein